KGLADRRGGRGWEAGSRKQEAGGRSREAGDDGPLGSADPQPARTVEIQMRQAIERKACARARVVYAAQHERAAQLLRAREQLVSRHPVGGNDAVVELRRADRRVDESEEGHAQKARPRFLALPQINAEDV